MDFYVIRTATQGLQVTATNLADDLYRLNISQPMESDWSKFENHLEAAKTVLSHLHVDLTSIQVDTVASTADGYIFIIT